MQRPQLYPTRSQVSSKKAAQGTNDRAFRKRETRTRYVQKRSTKSLSLSLSTSLFSLSTFLSLPPSLPASLSFSLYTCLYACLSPPLPHSPRQTHQTHESSSRRPAPISIPEKPRRNAHSTRLFKQVAAPICGAPSRHNNIREVRLHPADCWSHLPWRLVRRAQSSLQIFPKRWIELVLLPVAAWQQYPQAGQLIHPERTESER